MPRSAAESSSPARASPSIRTRIVEVPVKRARIALSATITGASRPNHERNACSPRSGRCRARPSRRRQRGAEDGAGARHDALGDRVERGIEQRCSRSAQRLAEAGRASSTRTAGMKVSSRTSADRMPNAAIRPKSRTAGRRSSRATRSPPRRCRAGGDHHRADPGERERDGGAVVAELVVALVVALQDLHGVARRHRQHQHGRDRRPRRQVEAECRRDPHAQTTESAAVASGSTTACAVRNAS